MAEKFNQADYQAALEGNDPELINADDNADITGDVVRGANRKEVTNNGYSMEDLGDDEPDSSDVPLDNELADGVVDEPEEPVYKKDQVQKIVQTRVNTYNKRIEKLSGYKNAVDKICEVTGLDFNTLVNRLGSMSDTEQANILGIPVEKVRETRETRRQIEAEQGKARTLQRQLEETTLKADPKYSDFDLFKDEIDDLLDDNPKLTLKQAYVLAKGDTAVNAAARDAEQRVIARQVNASKKAVVKPTGSVNSGNAGPKVDQVAVRAAKAVGMDPAEYLAFQQIDNIDAYRAMRGKNKK